MTAPSVRHLRTSFWKKPRRRLDAIIREVEAGSATIVVDGFVPHRVRKTLSTATKWNCKGSFRPGAAPASWQATTFLIGEYVEGAARTTGFTVADVFWSTRASSRTRSWRKMQIMKMARQQSRPPDAHLPITEHGMHCFPRTFGLSARSSIVKGRAAAFTGVRELDRYGRRSPEGDSLLWPDPPGGKTGARIRSSRGSATASRPWPF